MKEDVVTIVIFGGNGDLAHRKLLPALYNLHVDGLLPPRIAIVGVGRKALTDEAYREFAKDGVSKFSRRPIDEPAWQAFAGHAVLRQRVDRRRARVGAARRPARHHRARAQAAGRSDLLPGGAAVAVRADREAAGARAVRARKEDRPVSRLIVEKPIGHDLESARAINDAIAEVFDERQIYRIDHYLGKETVQNILVLRFANSIFEPLFNQKYVDHVQITVAEEEGVGTRAGYYEQAGALRDMVQNHMLQLLALVAMEPPHALDADVVRDEKLEILQSLRPMDGPDVDANVVRAQYGRRLHRRQSRCRATVEEPGVEPDSTIETFVALQLFIDNWRWAGVPFFLRTGKRLPKRASEISVQLKEVPPILFNANPAARLDPNVLSIRIQPDEGISLRHQLQDAGAAGPHLPGEDGLPLRQHVRRLDAGGVRAAAARRDERRRHALHAPRRRRGGVAVGHADPRTLGRN